MTEQFAFEEITEAELKAETTTTTSRSKTKKFDDTDRSQTGWFKLPHIMGYCTVPEHDELQKLIAETSEEKKEWREQHYPNRMTYFIDPYHVCRDCYIGQVDVECRNKSLPPKDFGGVADAN